MSTKQRRFAERVSAFALVAIAAGALFAARASSSTPALEREFRATYPQLSVPAGSFAGVAIDKLAVPGLRLAAREDHTVDEGGVVLSYGDPAGEIRVVVKLAVARDAAAARHFVDVELHAIQATLPRASDPSFGDHAFADDGGRGDSLVVGAAANVAWVVHSDRPTAPSAADIVHSLRALAVEGVPSFPAPTVTLPSEVPLAGAAFRVVAASGLTPRLRAEGAYVAHGKSAPVVRPFGPGPIAVIATAVDELGRVGATRIETVVR